MIYKKVVYPVLAKADAEFVHERTLGALQIAQSQPLGRWALRQMAGRYEETAVSLFNLTFPNVIGMAAGFDKDVRVATGLAELGFGHIEVGTLTPRSQVGNPRPRIFRLREDDALINRMGFPNGGVETAVPRLKKLHEQSRRFVLGVSLGKQKETPLENAVDDYLYVMRQVYPYADYLAINISSPNTPGLRQLQSGNYLRHLLEGLKEETAVLAQTHSTRQHPLLVKIAPDLTDAELDEILEAVLATEIDGIIATNTTLSRAGLRSNNKEETGGLSGAPVKAKSNEIIAAIRRKTNGRLPIIGVGGIQTAADVEAKLAAGASLVQLYTGLIYEGPALIGRILREQHS